MSLHATVVVAVVAAVGSSIPVATLASLFVISHHVQASPQTLLCICLLHSRPDLCLVCLGRAMELGRECLALWGYKRVDELIWVKTNQLQRLIRTGRTGHWLNHSKEHCLVGVKGSPQINRNLDCDVLVAEVGAGHPGSVCCLPSLCSLGNPAELHKPSGTSCSANNNRRCYCHLEWSGRRAALHAMCRQLLHNGVVHLTLHVCICSSASHVQVRETSRKPDEMYSLLERLSPGTRKLEIFARPHNVQPGWVCLGNQLDGTKIADPEMLAAYTKAYGNPTTPKRQQPHSKN